MSAETEELLGGARDGRPGDETLERALAELERLPPAASEGELAAAARRLGIDLRELGRMREALLALGALDRPAAPPAGPSRELGGCRLLEPLSRGGQGSVWRALHAGLGREVALKILRTDRERSRPHLTRRFRNEAEALGRLRHPNVVVIHDAGQGPEGELFLVLDLVPGEALSELIDEAPLPPRRVAELGARLADALQAAHARGILHRDVKPGNVIVDPRGQPVLVDFGLARDLETPRVTLSGVGMGTLGFASPEQVRGDSRVDARTDVYGLGATLLAALGEQPGQPAAGPEELLAVLRRAKAEEPAARYPTAGALGKDLERWLRGEPTQVAPGGPSWRAGWLRRPAALAPVLGLVLLGIAAVAGSLSAGRRAAWSAEAARARERLAAARAPFRAARVTAALPPRGELDAALAALEDLARRAPDEEAARALRAEAGRARGAVAVELELDGGRADAARAAAEALEPGPERELLRALAELAAGRTAAAGQHLAALSPLPSEPRFELESGLAHAAVEAARQEPERALERLRRLRPLAASLGLETALGARQTAALASCRAGLERDPQAERLSTLAGLVPDLPQGELAPLAVSAAKGALGAPPSEPLLLALEGLLSAVEARGLSLLAGSEVSRACVRVCEAHLAAQRLEAAARAFGRALRIDAWAVPPVELRVALNELSRRGIVARDARAWVQASLLRLTTGLGEEQSARAALAALVPEVHGEVRELARQGSDWESRLLAAHTWVMAGSPEEEAAEVVAWLRVVVEDPRAPRLWKSRAELLLGAELMRAAAWEEALTHLRLAMALEHESPDECLVREVECLLELGRGAEARQVAVQVQARADERARRSAEGPRARVEGRPHLDPLRFDGPDEGGAPLRQRRTLVALFLARGDLAAADELLEAMRRVDPEAQPTRAAEVALGLAHGRTAEARRAFDALDLTSPRWPLLLAWLEDVGLALERSGNREGAEALRSWLPPR